MKARRWEPSSERRSACLVINADLMLAMRTWTCPNCSSGHHRDTNAAINIAALAT
ncbi:hypothetical protein EQG67_14770 [Kosakonia cowanii]|uniref:zinc ribbon domain-containing protein n=1 Tax=Kosakonia cowanii TaxID=208223 RepID=UPI000FECC04A|nr:hypothetical protein EQG67_14770 [Kosakonia cowanii]